jgi:glycosyltransferase involved in cell wall biosynthesis
MHQKRPRVSVLLPAFEAGWCLGDCLNSVLRQTEPDWECVVVDDGSTDDTPAIVRHFAAADGRFRSVSTPHRGLVTALNTGLGHCRGRFVARMDADDLMHRRRLEEQASLLEARADLDAVACHVRLFPRARLRDGTREYERWLNAIDSPERVRAEAFIECPVAHPTLTFRRGCLTESRYRDEGWPEDYDLVLRLLESGRRIGVVPRRRLLWRDHDRRLCRTSGVYALERFTQCKAAYLARSFLARSEVYILWGHGSTGRGLRRGLLDLGKRPSYIVEVHEGRIGNRIAGAPVIRPDDLPGLPRHPLIVSVAGRGPRDLIRARLGTFGFRETRDFVCAA